MGHILDQTAEETGAKDDKTIAVAEGLVAMGLSPVMAMKTMGLAKGTVGYKLLTEQMNKIKLENERKNKEGSYSAPNQGGPVDRLKSVWNNIFK